MNIVITGSEGFLGKHLVEKLQDDGYGPFRVPSQIYDLRTRAGVDALFAHAGEVDILYHLAALIGGIGANRANPGRFFYDNMMMGLNVIEAARQHWVKRIIVVGTTCGYPKFCSIPFIERDLFNGYPEETNAPYGIAKRALLTMLEAYRQEYALNYVYAIPTNLFGPGDDFEDETSHVIPALIKKCLTAKEAGDSSITVWGGGTASRDFVYVEDVAEALVKMMDCSPNVVMNLGSGQEVKISRLVEIIKFVTGFTGKTRWDDSKPDGQPRRRLETSAAKRLIDWEATTGLEEGIKKTVEWYINER